MQEKTIVEFKITQLLNTEISLYNTARCKTLPGNSRFRRLSNTANYNYYVIVQSSLPVEHRCAGIKTIGYDNLHPRIIRNR